MVKLHTAEYSMPIWWQSHSEKKKIRLCFTGDAIARKLKNNELCSIIRMKGFMCNVQEIGSAYEVSKKCGCIVKYVDEWSTSLHCCCWKSRQNVRPKRFKWKKCSNGIPDPNYDLMLLNLIVNQTANWQLKQLRKNARDLERHNLVIGV